MKEKKNKATWWHSSNQSESKVQSYEKQVIFSI